MTLIIITTVLYRGGTPRLGRVNRLAEDHTANWWWSGDWNHAVGLQDLKFIILVSVSSDSSKRKP